MQENQIPGHSYPRKSIVRPKMVSNRRFLLKSSTKYLNIVERVSMQDGCGRKTTEFLIRVLGSPGKTHKTKCSINNSGV